MNTTYFFFLKSEADIFVFEDQNNNFVHKSVPLPKCHKVLPLVTFLSPSIHIWRYSPFRALTSIIRHLHSSLFSAVLLHPLIPISRNASLWTTSAHLVLGLPAGLWCGSSRLKPLLESFLLPFFLCDLPILIF